MRRKPAGAKWGKRPYKPHPFDKGIIRVSQTPADYESGAAYEVMARDLQSGDCAPARIDWPPGVETPGRPGRELMKAWPIVRTDGAILLWIRADTGLSKPAIDALAQVKGKRRDWRMRQPTPGPCAYLLLDNLFPGMEQELTLTITAGATGLSRPQDISS